MASPPKCKVCGASHWSGQPHAFAKAVGAEPKSRAAKPAPAVKPAAIVPAAGPGDALAAYIADQKAARASYMRDYRARQKEAKT